MPPMREEPMARAASGSIPRRPIIAVSARTNIGSLAIASIAGIASCQISLRSEDAVASFGSVAGAFTADLRDPPRRVGRGRRENFRMDESRENLDAVDEPRSGTVEVSRAVYGINAAASHRRKIAPAGEADERRRFPGGALEA